MISISLILMVAWSSPWKNAAEATAPWISKDREEGRIKFFDDLGQKADSISASAMTRLREGSRYENLESESPRPPSMTKPSAASATEEGDIETKGAHELKEIPWAAHRTLYPHLNRQGSWLWPVEKARVVSGFGSRGGQPHEGLDLRAAYGTRVDAAASGRIVFSGDLKGYGKTLVIYHGAGWSTVYAHLSSLSTSRGRLVERGDAIGLSGDSGKASGPHLHFEVRQEGRPVNPLSLNFSQTPYLASRTP